MNRPDYLPDSPCEKCLIEFRHCPLTPNACKEYRGYETAKATAKAVLEHLIAHPDKGEWTEANKEDCIKIKTLKSMLSDLEAMG
jgi:hypothetical protein